MTTPTIRHTIIKPKENINSLQFVKIQPTDLSKKAVEQIKLAEESKITKDKIKEGEEEWQNNLLNWKLKRRQNLPQTPQREPNSLADNFDDDNGNRKIKTFAEMVEDRAKKGGARMGFNLQSYAASEDSEEGDTDYTQNNSINPHTTVANNGKPTSPPPAHPTPVNYNHCPDSDKSEAPATRSVPLAQNTQTLEQHFKDKLKLPNPERAPEAAPSSTFTNEKVAHADHYDGDDREHDLDDNDDEEDGDEDEDDIEQDEEERHEEEEQKRRQRTDFVAKLKVFENLTKPTAPAPDITPTRAPLNTKPTSTPLRSITPKVLTPDLAPTRLSESRVSFSEPVTTATTTTTTTIPSRLTPRPTQPQPLSSELSPVGASARIQAPPDTTVQIRISSKTSLEQPQISSPKRNSTLQFAPEPVLVRTTPFMTAEIQSPINHTNNNNNNNNNNSDNDNDNDITKSPVLSGQLSLQIAPFSNKLQTTPVTNPVFSPRQSRGVPIDENLRSPQAIPSPEIMLQSRTFEPSLIKKSPPISSPVSTRNSSSLSATPDIAPPQQRVPKQLLIPPEISPIQAPQQQQPLQQHQQRVQPPSEPLAVRPEASARNHAPSKQLRPAPPAEPNSPIRAPKPQIAPDKTPVLSVSGKKRCSSCREELGRGAAAFVVESLNLVYHTNCFRCSVCHVNLSNGFRGVDVRVHVGALHCQNCYSKDGLSYSRV